ncbi:hypothetical protein [Micromonospora chokoriensis]|uniref:hypothetical protein n=1 Tax=Micromonospora chokoriensis TaxID=356851 RepID=UPI0004C41ED3|nr:hypothetical protein [Micromonospora chokoriensis]
MTAPAAGARFQLKIELYLGAIHGWVDITADLRGAVTITRGRTSEGNRADPGECGFRLDNLSGDYSPRNPLGQWYGYLGRNTPVRVSAGPIGGALVGRFYGEIASWPPGWSIEGKDRYTDVDAAGILRRLGQGEQPAWSPIRRTVQAGTSLLAYWPLEDEADATEAASAVTGIAAMQRAGTVAFAAGDVNVSAGGTTRWGTLPLPSLTAAGSLTGQVPAGVSSPVAWSVHMFWQSVGGTDDNLALVGWDAEAGGTYARWELVQDRGGVDGTYLVGYAAGGAATVVWSTITTFGGPADLVISAAQSGGSISVTVKFGTLTSSASVAGTLTRITAVALNPNRATFAVSDEFIVGHLRVWDTAAITPMAFGDLQSYRGESATARLARVCAEAGIPLTGTAVASDTTLGPQPVATLQALFDESVEADAGMLFEQRGALGLACRTRSSLYNQTPLDVPYTRLIPPFAPVDDADQVRNDVTVKRTGGSSARSVQAVGPLAAVPPPDGVGVYPTEIELNLFADAPLQDHAEWIRHLGTIDQPRYPQVSVQLAEPEWQADLPGMAALLAVDSGAALRVTSLPSWAAGDARLLVTGYTETLDEWLWKLTFAARPATPWDVAEADGDPRVAADGSTLGSLLTAGGMFIGITSTIQNGLWTTAAADFPLDVRVGGERIRLSAITGGSSPQTGTISARGINGVQRAWAAGTEVDVWAPAVAPL